MEASKVRSALEADWPELASMLVEHDADPDRSGLPYLTALAVIGLIWTIRIFRGPRDEPPKWRYRVR